MYIYILCSIYFERKKKRQERVRERGDRESEMDKQPGRVVHMVFFFFCTYACTGLENNALSYHLSCMSFVKDYLPLALTS